MSAFLELNNVKKHFKTPRGMLHAVDGVTFKIKQGETLGVVGESGCGKSTLGRTINHLLEVTSGQIIFEGRDITHLTHKEIINLRRDMQMIFQDPFSSLDPRMSLSQIIAEPLIIYKAYKDKQDLAKKVAELMSTVGLSRRLANLYPHELDGGRRQRIGVARALSLNPKFIICDEPVSALDVSIQAQILNLMQDIQEERNLTYLFITHNMSVVKHMSDEIMVMYLGCMVEFASPQNIFDRQLHPYTKALISAVPIPVLGAKKVRKLVKGEISSPIEPKPGCRFAGRCEYAQDKCFVEDPPTIEAMKDHFVSCHFVREINGLTD